MKLSKDNLGVFKKEMLDMIDVNIHNGDEGYQWVFKENIVENFLKAMLKYELIEKELLEKNL